MQPDQQPGIYFLVIPMDKWDTFVSFLGGLDIEVSSYTLYNGSYYIQQTDELMEAAMMFDQEDMVPGNDYSTEFFTLSNVPGALWP